ncbi:hypothetical protein [Algoriphagus vanfongensis]|uniref:hypothetical protein n=1 Tax=Algoriphagus vanfongensis TaxID=426371 RepID=UPI00047E72FC|nr:hypothetical protein [Algoriphagus vanfongensis]
MEQQEKINVTTKQLASGNCQVKFTVENSAEQQYGYLLMSEPRPVGEIIQEVQRRLEQRRAAAKRINPLFPLAPAQDDADFYLFSA